MQEGGWYGKPGDVVRGVFALTVDYSPLVCQAGLDWMDEGARERGRLGARRTFPTSLVRGPT